MQIGASRVWGNVIPVEDKVDGWKIESEIVDKVFWRLSHKVKWNMIYINEAIIHLIRWNGLVAVEFRVK